MPKNARGQHDAETQDALFPAWQPTSPPPVDSPLVELPPITKATSLAGLALAYRNHLMISEHTAHTIDCFLSDLRLLTRFIGAEIPIGTVTRPQIVDWLMHLRWDSIDKPAPKTMARRVTFLKNFFGWLDHESILPENIAEKITFARPLPPLPELLFEEELTRLADAAADDIRCQLLIALALDAGLKKEEILGISLHHIDLSDPNRPTLAVRFQGQSRPQRERLLELPAGFTSMYQRYLNQYQPQEKVFECTDRNLTYILTRVADRAKITKRVTLQLLRDCYAVRQLRQGGTLLQLREKLGLSDEAWHETQEKYRKLAFPV